MSRIKLGQLQLAHVELLTPVLDKSVEFFTKLLGMTIVHKTEDKFYLRAYEDRSIYSLVLTQSDRNGLGHAAFLVDSEETLNTYVESIEKSGQPGEWVDKSFGNGRGYKFPDKDGHIIELYTENDKFVAPEDFSSHINSRAQRRPLRGIPVRRIDHVNLMVNADKVDENVEFFSDCLGFTLNEYVYNDDGSKFAAWLSFSNLVHEVGMFTDGLGGNGRLHHLAFWYGIPQHLNDLAELCTEYDIPIEIGPIKHGVSQALCMYIIEPGGNRIELFGDSGYLIFESQWEPVSWSKQELVEYGVNIYGGPDYHLPETYLTYGTPSIESELEAENRYHNLRENRLHEVNWDIEMKLENE